MKQKKSSLYTLRKNYSSGELLTEKNIEKDPLKTFERWMNIAIEENVNEPNAMNLSTVNEDGKPSSRIVLLRGFDTKGFVFYTNYRSRKGHELMINPHAALTLFWPELEKQVRIEGKVKKVSKAMSDVYFSSRPRESQIGAWASQQSSLLDSREELEKIVENIAQKFKNKNIPRPENWGGYCLVPERIEFWQGRANRLHDRVLFEKKNKKWKISRLFP